MQDQSFIYRVDATLLAAALLFLMLSLIYVGRWVGLKRKKGEEGVTTTAVSAMFGLMAFLLAFSFGMSGSRYDIRRQNIVTEANAIGTAILRSDLYRQEDRKAFRDDFKQYLEGRIKYFDAGSAGAAEADYGKKLWDRATQLSKDPSYFVASTQMVPALNDMFDQNTSRLIGELSRVPDSIVWMLFILALASSFYLGYSSAAKGHLDWLVAAGFCVFTSIVIYITLDLDRPRSGFIQLTTSHQAMVELRKMFDRD